MQLPEGRQTHGLKRTACLTRITSPDCFSPCASWCFPAMIEAIILDGTESMSRRTWIENRASLREAGEWTINVASGILEVGERQ